MNDDVLLFNIEPNKKIKKEKIDQSKIAPWIKSSTLKIKNPLAKMHNEIIEFYQYVTPSE
jgi:non-canonical poly(A) RNA polymerase PAPD5/7